MDWRGWLCFQGLWTFVAAYLQSHGEKDHWKNCQLYECEGIEINSWEGWIIQWSLWWKRGENSLQSQQSTHGRWGFYLFYLTD